MTAPTTGVLEHTIGSTGAFALNVRSNDVRVVAVDGDSVRIRARDGRDLTRLDTERGPGLLSVRAGGGVDELDVDVPRHATVVIEASSGDIIVRGLRSEQHYRTSSGDIQLDAVGGRLSAEAVSGDVRIVASARVEVSARTVSGDLAVQAGAIATLRAVTTSGDLRVAGRFEGEGPFSLETVSGDATLASAGPGLDITVSTITGDVRSEVEARQEGPRGQRRLVIGSGSPALSFRSTSGDLRIARAVPLPIEAPRPPAPPSAPTLEEDAAMSTDRLPAADLDVVPDDPELDILRALERGDIDVSEATRRLAALADDPDAGEDDHAG